MSGVEYMSAGGGVVDRINMSYDDLWSLCCDAQDSPQNDIYRISSMPGPSVGVPPGFAPLSPACPLSHSSCSSFSSSGSPGVIQRPSVFHSSPAAAAAPPASELSKTRPHPSVTRSHSVFSNDTTSSSTNQNVSSAIMTSFLANRCGQQQQQQRALIAGSADELLSLHRRLGRTASDPVSATALAAALAARVPPLGGSTSEDGSLLPSEGCLSLGAGAGGAIGAAAGGARYKTELCRPFEEHGACKYGDKCQFAHGRHELRTVSRHPKYKTDMCKTYHTTGLCPYGPRCHFIHDTEEAGAATAETTAARPDQRPGFDRQRSQLEDQLLALQQLQQLEHQQQQLDAVKKQLLLAALSSQQQRRLGSHGGASIGRSDSAPSARYAPCSAALRSSPSPPMIGVAHDPLMTSSVCESLGSLGMGSPPSSVSDSPSGSPSLSMFGGGGYGSGGDDVTTPAAALSYGSLPVNATCPFPGPHHPQGRFLRRTDSRAVAAPPPGFGRLGAATRSQATPPASAAGFYQSNLATPTSAAAGGSFVYPCNPFQSVSAAAFSDNSSPFHDSGSSPFQSEQDSTATRRGAGDAFPAAELVAASILGGTTPAQMLMLAAALQDLAVTKLQGPLSPLGGGGHVGSGGFQDATHFSAGGIIL